MDSRMTANPFGALTFVPWNHPWNQHHYKDLESVERSAALMKEAGLGMVRMDFLWNDIETEPNKFDFQKYDDIVDIFSKHDIKILGLLSYNANWAAAYWNSPPHKDWFTQYALSVVRRYKGKVGAWEICNEPNLDVYWQPLDEMKTYTLLLKTVYSALKKEDPNCQIVLGGLTRNFPLALKHIYGEGGRDFFDIINIHPFTDPLLPNAKQELREFYEAALKLMNENGDFDKKIWFTELGCPGTPSRDAAPDWWLGRNVTEEEQADWLKFCFTEILEWKGIDKIFWAFFRDTPDHFKTGVDYFGLVRRDFSKKPAYEVLKQLSTSFKDRRLSSEGGS